MARNLIDVGVVVELGIGFLSLVWHTLAALGKPETLAADPCLPSVASGV